MTDRWIKQSSSSRCWRPGRAAIATRGSSVKTSSHDAGTIYWPTWALAIARWINRHHALPRRRGVTGGRHGVAESHRSDRRGWLRNNRMCVTCAPNPLANHLKFADSALILVLGLWGRTQCTACPGVRVHARVPCSETGSSLMRHL
jgi:hypothetical protein